MAIKKKVVRKVVKEEEDETSFKTAIKDDSHLSSVEAILETISLAEMERYIAELEDMHRSRSVRTLNTKMLSSGKIQTKLTEAIIQNTALRSRVVEIKMRCFKIAKTLEDHAFNLKTYLKVEYGALLNTEFKTVADKNTAVEFPLENLRRYSQKLQMIISLADMVVNDIDQSSWAIKSIIDVLNINVKKEFGL